MTDPIKPRVDPTTLGRIQRAMSGQCPDCRGSGRRSTSKTCVTCSGSGRVEWQGICQIANAAHVPIARTVDALLELEARGLGERSRNTDGPELWRLVPRTTQC